MGQGRGLIILIATDPIQRGRRSAARFPPNLLRRQVMHRNSLIRRGRYQQPLAQPVRLTPAEITRVSGGGANVQHGNPGGEPASYNTPGHEGYGGEGSGSTGPGIEIRG